jgi:hypothetical protein
LKEHLQQVGFQWSYSHEDLFPGELSQQHIFIINDPYPRSNV